MDDVEDIETDDDYYAFLNLPRDVSWLNICNFINYFDCFAIQFSNFNKIFSTGHIRSN